MARNCGCGRRVYKEGDFIVKTSCPEITLEITQKEDMCFQVKGKVSCNTLPLQHVNVNLSSSSESILKHQISTTDKDGGFSSELNLLDNSIKEVEVTATVISNRSPVTKSITINF
ncbi:hypothetical protein MH116_12395 [Bacillus pumilus]|uniref:hypothetical protein n=1 Tax=Bacillus pumilus TaxID=1408 RepID=UPI0022829A78|nr:hypothetical protein [Bacillus pumilus]MCY7618654.1 hypothetical protein [Bacillus pumilus]